VHRLRLKEPGKLQQSMNLTVDIFALMNNIFCFSRTSLWTLLRPTYAWNPKMNDEVELNADEIETAEVEETTNELPTKSSTSARQLEIRRKIEEAQEAKRFREEFGMS
jgi:hypothetical protein